MSLSSGRAILGAFVLAMVVTLGTAVETAVAAADIPPLEERGPFPAAVLGRLHLFNIQEIMMGKMAEKSGQSKEARNLGHALVRDHGTADKRVMALAKRKELDVTATGATLEDVHLGKGKKFDRNFAEAVVVDHEKDIAEIKKDREASTDDELNVLLDELLPMLEGHVKVAQQILDSTSKQ